ncbi:hypothetical protein [Streptomyces sp. NPDC055036]
MAETEWQAATRKIKTAGMGATYRHIGGYGDIVVTHLHEPTGRVWWQKPDGPGLADRHRNLTCEDFLSVYELSRGE